MHVPFGDDIPIKRSASVDADGNGDMHSDFFVSLFFELSGKGKRSCKSKKRNDQGKIRKIIQEEKVSSPFLIPLHL